MKGIADVLVREALAGQHWAVTLALKDMLPTRSRKGSDPVEREPVASVEDAAQRIAETLARMEAGALDLGDARELIAGRKPSSRRATSPNWKPTLSRCEPRLQGCATRSRRWRGDDVSEGRRAHRCGNTGRRARKRASAASHASCVSNRTISVFCIVSGAVYAMTVTPAGSV